MTETKHPAGHLLQAYHDGELDASAAATIAAHLKTCATCRSELDELVRMDHLLAAAPEPELPRSVWHRVRPGHGRETRLRPALGFAACAVGVVLGVLFGPIRFSAEKTDTELAWTENLTLWSGTASSPLLSVYQSGRE